MSKVTIVLTAFLVFLSACAGAPSTAGGNSSGEASAREAEEAARAALAAMDGGGQNPAGASALAPDGRTPAQSGSGRAPARSGTGEKPAWVDTPAALDAVYPGGQYISAAGYGSERVLAERDALAKLTALFGQSIQAELKTLSTYSEAVKDGVIQLSESAAVNNSITTSTELDTLLGVETAEVWYDGRELYHAAVIMEKEKASLLYADLIRSNESVMADLTGMTPPQKNSFDGYLRYQLAGTIADANRVYANVLSYIGNTRGINPAEMKGGNDYRFMAAEVVKNIPIGITINDGKGDRIKDDRIRTAFSKAISGAGFRSGGTNSRYQLRINYTLSSVDLPNQRNKFVRYEITGDLVDTAEADGVLVSYNDASREGHLTITEAEERAVRAMEQKIPQDFEKKLGDYLSSLAAQRN